MFLLIVFTSPLQVEGFEIKTLMGMSAILEGKFVDAFHIEIGPQRWVRANLTVVEGIARLRKALGAYHPHLISRNADSCPDKVWRIQKDTDIPLSFWGHLKQGKHKK